jgi:spore maturation protein B
MVLNALGTLLPAILLTAVGLYGLCRQVDVFDAMTHGAIQGLRVTAGILPALVCLLPVMGMLRASGVLEAFTALLAPLFQLLGIPAETAGLMLLRPFSGSGALAMGSEIMAQHGPDSLIGRTAAVMLGSTETTFYVLAVYFGTVGIRKSRHALPAALCADLAGFLAAAWWVKVFWG